MSRILASIQIVEEIKEHPNANLLNITRILGWNVVTKKEETNIKDKVVYCEIDSMLPVSAEWLPEAIKIKIQRDNTSEYFRIKTLNIRRVFSQGIIIPLTNFNFNIINGIQNYDLEIGTDLTDALKIIKYDNDIETSSKIGFPSHLISKTDEKRIQSYPHFLEMFNQLKYYATVKLDGTSATYLYHDDNLIVCSRNLSLTPDTSIWWKIAEQLNFEMKYKNGDIDQNYAFQGEICGPSIQRNLLNLKELKFFVFNIIDLRTKEKVDYEKFIHLCRIYNLEHVPIEEEGIFNYVNIEAILQKAKGKYNKTKNHREGLVFRTLDQKLSFKVINNEYLNKYE